MQPHEDCRNWEYEHHPDRAKLTAECLRLEQEIASNPNSVIAAEAYDTRRVHHRMFAPLAPPKCKCLAGSYRGNKNCKAARHYTVGVGGDALVGVAPVQVAINMNTFEANCRKLEQSFISWRASLPPPAPELVLDELVRVLAKILEKFFQIHPYANGNGHTGRMLLLILMCRTGFPPADWSIDGKKDYSTQLSKYRRGEFEPLEEFILDAIAGLS